MAPSAAAGAGEALDMLRRAHDTGSPFRLVLLDWMMPNVDGIMLAREIRQDPRFRDLPLILLSSASHPGEAVRTEVGLAACLLKPAKPSELLNALLSALDTNGSLGQEAGKTTERENGTGFYALSSPRSPFPQDPFPVVPSGLRVLLAEDNPVNQKMATRLLEKRGCQVTLAGNGREAVAAFARDRFDLVLMDVQMPEMGGIEATERIRERERAWGGHVPVIALTAHAMTGDRERCLEAGMDDYVAKPIRREDLFAAMDRHCGTAGRAECQVRSAG